MEQYDCRASIFNPNNVKLRKWSAILAILSSSASIIGCLLIIIIYICWKDFRTTARSILLFISIADLFTATGYVIGSAEYLHYKVYLVHSSIPRAYNSSPYNSSAYNISCEVQSFVTTTSSIASFFWTTVLAFYLYMTIVYKMYKFVRRLMPMIHVISWGVPLVLCIVALVLKWLGPSVDDTSVSWCFVASCKPHWGHKLGQLLLGKGWEVASYILVIFFYTVTRIFIEIEKRRPLQFPVYASVLRMDKKVLFIPVVFLLVRIWGTTRYFISLMPSCMSSHCTEQYNCHCDNILYHPLLVYLQAIGDGAQGWGNAILFIAFSARIRRRITHAISDASWKLRSGSHHHDSTTDYDTINPPGDSLSASLTTDTPTTFYGSTSPNIIK